MAACQKNSTSDSFAGKFYQTFKKEITIYQNFFRKIKEEERPPNSFH